MKYPSSAPAPKLAPFALVLFLACQATAPEAAHCQEPEAEVPGVEVLTRGPVHEAFAGIVNFDPEPGIVVPKAPPEPIEELPPDERPEGDNVAWIPGYWAWDDERESFLWISGTWRQLPPGREWIPGYWTETTAGYQWISGYWSDASEEETVYLPPPPATVEVGPSVAAPSVDHAWAPGAWTWYEERYVWRPGYWVMGRPDWDWVPDCYVWTPRGYVFVPGYWDYPVARRGVLFAPVYFDSVVYSRAGYRYSPSIAISLNVFVDHLFLRPRYDHYYFGDYYEPRYERSGFYSCYHPAPRHRYYDPIYAHHRWTHRGDRDWDKRMRDSYTHRREHRESRPPHTWAEQRQQKPRGSDTERRHHELATPLARLAEAKDNPLRLRKLAEEDVKRLTQNRNEVRQSSNLRRATEAKPAAQHLAATGERDNRPKPSSVKRAKSPIVSKSIKELDQSRRPPEAPQIAKRDHTPRAQPQPTRPSRSDTKPQPSVAGRTHSGTDKPPTKETRPAPKQTDPRAREPRRAEKPKETPKPSSREPERRSQPESKPSPRPAQRPESKPQPQPQPRREPQKVREEPRHTPARPAPAPPRSAPQPQPRREPEPRRSEPPRERKESGSSSGSSREDDTRRKR